MWVNQINTTFTIQSNYFRQIFFDKNNFLKSNVLFQLEQKRGRKRNLKQPLSKQQRLERRLKREEKEAKKKQHSFMERIQIRRMSKLLSPSQQYPGRYDAEEELKLPEIPNCETYVRNEFRTKFYTLKEALELHRLLQKPSMYNHPNGFLKIRFELNMTTEKATKQVSNSQEIVPVPHSFPHNEKRTILAFANCKENQESAVNAGAEIAVGPDVIKKILKGQFLINDYDFCVAHTDISSAMLPLRGLLRSKFPTVNNGALGTNFTEIINRFMTGVKLVIKGDPIYPQWGLSEPIIGQLNMTDKQIEENIAVIVEALCKHRNVALGPFINRATLMVVPDKAFFSLDIKKYLPIPTEEEIEKLESRQKKKKKAKQQKNKEVKEIIDNDYHLIELM